MFTFTIEKQQPVFTETLTPPACHSASIAELPDGGLACVWYSGSFEGSRDTVLYWSKSGSEGGWEKPRVIVELPGLSTGNPVLWHDGEKLNLYFVILYGDWWSEAKVSCTSSKDNGATWSQIKLLWDEAGTMLRTPPLRLTTGEILLPIYDERAWCSLILRSEDNGQTWRKYGDATARGITIQPTLVELEDGRVLAYSRSSKGFIYVSWSYNKGLSWTASQPLPLVNNNTGIDLIRCNEGLLLVHNDTATGRHRLVVSHSADEGKHWELAAVLEDSEGEFSYPTMIQAHSGKIHIVYTNQRHTINHIEAVLGR